MKNDAALKAGQARKGDHRLLTDMKAGGATEYLAIPMRFSDRHLHAISFATDRIGGFTDGQMRQLKSAASGFAIALEPMMLRRETRELLNTYIGHEQAARVLDGCVQRGFYETIETAMMFADLEGYTAMSNREPISTVVGLLDSYFGAITEAVIAHQGQVLKFLGDGILSIFPTFAREGAGVGRQRTYAALLDAKETILKSGLPIEFRAILHQGTVVYGNIGGIGRLDFTVVGPAVNLASRLQPVSKELRCPVLATRRFAESMDQFVSIGSAAVRNFSEPIELYAPRHR